MNNIKFILVSALILSGCASQIMNNYVGKPLTEPVSDYGMPSGSFDITKDERAFVWERQTTRVVPGSSHTTTNFNGTQNFLGNSSMMFATAHSTTQTTPGYVSTDSCSYILYARKERSDIEGPAAWTVTGFRKPRLMCE